MRKNGQLITCDRCGATTFVTVIGEGEADGGYTRWNKFEEAVDWHDIKLAIQPKSVTLCPKCSAEYFRLERTFMGKVDDADEENS